ncbi:hypothetical protein L7F22_049068 [Adiantum nelumboides]|nr:hypothetical protein [Adiantum nelumboides]
MHSASQASELQRGGIGSTKDAEENAGEVEVVEKEGQQWRMWAEEEVAASAERVWGVVSQFCSAEAWLVGLNTCEKVEGEERIAGCVRLCKGSSDFSAGGLTATGAVPRAGGTGEWTPAVVDAQAPKNWSREKLLRLDDSEMLLSYEVLDSNLDLRGYSAHLQVVNAGTSSSSRSSSPTESYSCCTLRWTAQMDPIPFTSKDRISDLLLEVFRRNVQKLRHIVCTS